MDNLLQQRIQRLLSKLQQTVQIERMDPTRPPAGETLQLPFGRKPDISGAFRRILFDMGEGQKAGRVMGAASPQQGQILGAYDNGNQGRPGEAVADLPTTIGNFFGDNLLRPAFRANEKYVQPAMKQAGKIPGELRKWIDYQLNQGVKNYKPPVNAGNEMWDSYKKYNEGVQQKVGDKLRQ